MKLYIFALSTTPLPASFGSEYWTIRRMFSKKPDPSTYDWMTFASLKLVNSESLPVSPDHSMTAVLLSFSATVSAAATALGAAALSVLHAVERTSAGMATAVAATIQRE